MKWATDTIKWWEQLQTKKKKNKLNVKEEYESRGQVVKLPIVVRNCRILAGRRGEHKVRVIVVQQRKWKKNQGMMNV